MNTPAAQSSHTDKSFRTLFIIWAAFLAAIFNFFLITMLVPRTAPESDNQALAFALAAVAFPLVPFSFALKRKLLERAVTEQRPQLVMSAYIVALAMCEAACVMGLLVYFMSDVPYYFLWFIAGALAIFLHRPRREDFLAASYKSNSNVG